MWFLRLMFMLFTHIRRSSRGKAVTKDSRVIHHLTFSSCPVLPRMAAAQLPIRLRKLRRLASLKHHLLIKLLVTQASTNELPIACCSKVNRLTTMILRYRAKQRKYYIWVNLTSVLFSIFAVIVLSMGICSATALIFWFEEHYWLLPAFIIANVLISWFLLKEIIFKSFLFSYGQGFITNHEIKSLNERYCDQYI